MEDRQRQRWQRLGPQLEHHTELAKPTLGANWQSITKAQARQSHSTMLPPHLENSTLVVPAPVSNVNKAKSNHQSSSLQKSTRSGHACTKMGNIIYRSGRLSVTQLTQCLEWLGEKHQINLPNSVLAHNCSGIRPGTQRQNPAGTQSILSLGPQYCWC